MVRGGCGVDEQAVDPDVTHALPGHGLRVGVGVCVCVVCNECNVSELTCEISSKEKSPWYRTSTSTFVTGEGGFSGLAIRVMLLGLRIGYE